MIEPVEFEVPATCAHLGPGFGVLGLALDLPLRVTATRADTEGVDVERRGTLEETQLDQRHDGLLRGLIGAAEKFKIKLPTGLHIVVDSEVPPATGLGTNTATFVAGIAIATRFAKRPPDDDELLALLVDLGGDAAHGAASLRGGLASACQHGTQQEPRYQMVAHPMHADWRFVVACPNVRLATADVRRILPPTLPHAVTRRTTSRLLGLLHALGAGEEERLADFLVDEVHVPFRRRLLAGMDESIAAGREAGAAGVTISGHGPSLIALTMNADACPGIAEAMRAAFADADQEAATLVLRSRTHGALAD